jgi:broad specificity phosphatase PhoE
MVSPFQNAIRWQHRHYHGPVPSIVLVRHAQGSFGGASYDVLSEVGHEQAAAAAAELQRREVTVARVLSGTLRRQLDTARPIATAFGLDVALDGRWNEYSADDILAHHSTTDARMDRTGDDAVEISSRDFQALLEGALNAWIDAGADGPADEPYPAFAARVRAALEAAADGLGSGAAAVVSTSGGPIAAICAALMGAPPASLVQFNRVAINTGITKVTAGRGGLTLISFNEHSHLDGPARSLLTYR